MPGVNSYSSKKTLQQQDFQFSVLYTAISVIFGCKTGDKLYKCTPISLILCTSPSSRQTSPELSGLGPLGVSCGVWHRDVCIGSFGPCGLQGGASVDRAPSSASRGGFNVVAYQCVYVIVNQS